MIDTTSAAPSERKSFETHAKERGYRLDRSTGGGYLYGQAAIAWRAWQAARTQPAPPAVAEPFTAVQRERMFRNRPSNVGNGLSLADWHRVLQYVEACHGIGIKKGDSNG